MARVVKATPSEPTVDLEASLLAAEQEAATYRLWFEDHKALLAYACNLVTGNTARNRDITPTDSHPESRREVAVEDDNDPGRWRVVAYGFDSDVAKLFDHLRAVPPSDPDAH